MGRAPCCDKANVKRGPWSPEEDAKLKAFIEEHGTWGNWIALPQKIGLKRCGKSCRLRWLNYLRPNLKHGSFSEEEDSIICSLYISIGSRWSVIAAQLPGRTDNDIKNYWNTRLRKRLLGRRRSSSRVSVPLARDQQHQEGGLLSASALERMQLHAQLRNSSSDFYSDPALWPAGCPFRGAALRSQQSDATVAAAEASSSAVVVGNVVGSVVDQPDRSSVGGSSTASARGLRDQEIGGAVVQGGDIVSFGDGQLGDFEDMSWWVDDGGFEQKLPFSNYWNSPRLHEPPQPIPADYILGYI